MSPMGDGRLAGREWLTTPRVAGPTLALFALANTAWALVLVLAWTGRASLATCFVLATAAAFAIFTPLHDAAHLGLGRSRPLNAVVGRASALVLGGAFPAFRFVHLEHHRNTNDPEADPDFWSGAGPAFLRPLRWLTQDLHYYAFYGARLAQQPWAERLEVALVLGGLALFVAAAVATGHGAGVFLAWLLPARAALALLAFCFDYLPHRPHAVRSRVDPYRATHVRSDAVLTPLFLYQNYHLIHHLYPAIPFYRYGQVWRAQREDLLARGASDRRLFG